MPTPNVPTPNVLTPTVLTPNVPTASWSIERASPAAVAQSRRAGSRHRTSTHSASTQCGRVHTDIVTLPNHSFYATSNSVAEGLWRLIALLIVTDLVAIASAALGLPLSDPIPLPGSGRSAVVRCRIPADGTVVVKSYLDTTEGKESFAAETAGLTFVAATGAGPGLLAADASHHLIVMSDLGTAPSLADLLLGDSSSQAADALLAWASACGNLAASTAGRRAEFDQLAAPARHMHWFKRRIWQIPELLDDASIEAPAGLADELSDLTSLLTPGQFDVFSPGDICPDNNLITTAGVKFIDFEEAGFHSAFLDAAYLRMPFSTCWCVFTLPDDLARRAEARYRELVSGTFPDLAADEVWQPGVHRACAAWTLHALTYLLDRSVLADASMNSLATHAPTSRQLLRYRWQRLSAQLDQAAELPAISALMANLLAATHSWRAPGLPPYPAFRLAT